MNQLLWAATCVMLAAPTLCVLACSPDAPAAQEKSGTGDVNALVASQVASEFGVWHRASDGRVAPVDIRVEPGPTIVPAVEVLRAVPPRDHWHAYLVAVQADTVCLAGGFSSPDLKCIARWIARADSPDLAETSRILAVLADENGALRVFPVAEPPDRSERQTVQVWERIRPDNWPQDTVFSLPQAESVVRITMLSQQVRTYEQSWRAVAYDFRFDSGGWLLAWSRRSSDTFSSGAPSQ